MATKKQSPETNDELAQPQIDELKADLQRTQADFVNFRRRSEEAKGQILDLARQDVALEVLPLIDNIGRALGHLPDELQGNPWAQGVEQIAHQADEVLGQMGIERIKAIGETFDPHLHEAVAQDDDGDMVIEELQAGYKMGDRVIRHAMVRVGK